MNWLNLELTTLRSEEYLGSEPIQRATWLNLLAYCADQENSGVIKNCADWGSRRWLQLLGITKEEVLSASDLWTWKGDDLHVWKYPKAKEAEVRRKREQGKKGGRPPKTKDEKPDGSPDAKPDGSILQKRNRKGKEEEVEGNKKKDIFSLPAEAVRLADKIIAHVRTINSNPSNLSDSKIEKTRYSWSDAIDKANRIDGRTWEQLGRMLDFAINDDFWSGNILSGAKFREKYDQLEAKSNKLSPPSKQSQAPQFISLPKSSDIEVSSL